jgi:hypothetical protein
MLLAAGVATPYDIRTTSNIYPKAPRRCSRTRIGAYRCDQRLCDETSLAPPQPAELFSFANWNLLPGVGFFIRSDFRRHAAHRLQDVFSPERTLWIPETATCGARNSRVDRAGCFPSALFIPPAESAPGDFVRALK